MNRISPAKPATNKSVSFKNRRKEEIFVPVFNDASSHISNARGPKRPDEYECLRH